MKGSSGLTLSSVGAREVEDEEEEENEDEEGDGLVDLMDEWINEGLLTRALSAVGAGEEEDEERERGRGRE